MYNSKKLFIINNLNSDSFEKRHKPTLNILIKNNYLLHRYNGCFDIYNIENMEKINTDYMNIEGKYFDWNDNKLKKEMDIDLLCDYFDILFLSKNNHDGKIKIYKLEDGKVKYL